MKPLPTNPFERQERAMAALLGDIADTKAKGFERLDALHAIHRDRAGSNVPRSDK